MDNKLQQEIDDMSKAIKTDNYPMSIGELANLYLEGDLNINPIYQRMFRWDINQQSALIESILLSIPLPPIYVYQNGAGKWNLIDGQQRLSTIFKFMNILKTDKEVEEDAQENGIDLSKKEALTKTKFLPSLEGKFWESEDEQNSLTDAQRRYIKRAKILIIIIDKSSDEFAQYEMFQRLNTGGSHLSPQEIRNCILVMRDEEIYKVMKELSKYENFVKALPLSEKDVDEQGYMELVVKYFVLRFSEMNVGDSENYNNFLTDEIINIVKSKSIDYEEEVRNFKRVFDLIVKEMDENAFKKYDLQKGKHVGPVLVGTYEAIIPGVSDNIEYYENNDGKLTEKIEDMFSTEDYQSAVKRGVRPVSRMKKLAAFSKEAFSSES